MILIKYFPKKHKDIIHACIKALRAGKVVAYPTDTSYGLAVDATNVKAIKRLYKVKERQSTKPVHVVVPSVAYAKKLVRWNSATLKLTKKFWPGPLSIVGGLRVEGLGLSLKTLSARTGFLGVRMPNNKIALDLARGLARPITTPSANPSAEKSGGYDSYTAQDIIKQFQKKKYKPDIILDAGRLPKRKPSTMVKVVDDQVSVLRVGPIKEKSIMSLLNTKDTKYTKL